MSERTIPWMVMVLPLAIVLLSALSMTWYFSQRLTYYASVENARDLQSLVERAQQQDGVRVDDIKALFAYREEQRENDMRRTLKERVGVAYETAHFLFERYQGRVDSVTLKSLIRDALSQMVWEGSYHYVWITDYEGNNILAGDANMQTRNLYDYRDADGKLVIREEIALVRSSGEGYMKTRFASKDETYMLYMKNFGKFDWFFGSAMAESSARSALQQQLLRLIESVPWEPDTFVVLLDANGSELVRSRASGRLSDPVTAERAAGLVQNEWIKDGNVFLHRQPVGTYGWQIVSGFDLRKFEQTFAVRSQALKEGITDERLKIAKAAAGIAVLVALVSLLLSRQIVAAFGRYREQVKVREAALREFNATLEARVREEVAKQRQSEKMLIQQSKMAAMGDMISMIAHQWRQPLNQLSYILMNIEGAFEHGEMNETFLKEKLGDGERTLTYMSHTIDDFRHFFRPDKAREPVQVHELIEHTLRLLSKSLSTLNITVETSYECTLELPLYRNELIQVVINILNNAKDALARRGIPLPRIRVDCYETGQFVVIRICDNAGGVEAAVQERIFEPYFSTKEERNGSGLGLYMSRTIIEEHFNGEIDFENGPEGACFFIRIGRLQLTAPTAP